MLFLFLALSCLRFLNRKRLLGVKRSNLAQQFKNQTVLITGGANGIGKQQALAFLRRGANLVIWDVNSDVLDEAISEFKQQFPSAVIHDAVVDVTDRQSVYEVARHVLHVCGKVDILINNAGIVSGQLLLDTPDEKIVQTMRVNTLAHFWTVKAFLPAMLEMGSGHIVTIASIASFVGIPQLVDYTASKFAVRGFHEALSSELDHLGFGQRIHTTCICPGPIRTKLFEGFASNPLAPILLPSTVAQEIVDAVEEKRRLVVIPSSAYPFVAVLPNVLPYRVSKWIGSLSDTQSSMANFNPAHANETFKLLSTE